MEQDTQGKYQSQESWRKELLGKELIRSLLYQRVVHQEDTLQKLKIKSLCEIYRDSLSTYSHFHLLQFQLPTINQDLKILPRKF